MPSFGYFHQKQRTWLSNDFSKHFFTTVISITVVKTESFIEFLISVFFCHSILGKFFWSKLNTVCQLGKIINDQILQKTTTTTTTATTRNHSMWSFYCSVGWIHQQQGIYPCCFWHGYINFADNYLGALKFNLK